MPRQRLEPIDLPELRKLRKPYYTTREVAALVGKSPDTVSRMVHAGEFPGCQNFGGSVGVLFPRPVVKRYLKMRARPVRRSPSNNGH